MQAKEHNQNQVSRQQNGPLHCIDRQWFYATSEPRLYGPYETQEEAEEALARHGGT